MFLKSWNFSYTGSYQSVKLSAGVYKFECWGASGGDDLPRVGGRGAYVSGVIHIKTQTRFYVYVGEHGKNNQKNTFNGGGAGWIHETDPNPSGGGSVS